MPPFLEEDSTPPGRATTATWWQVQPRSALFRASRSLVVEGQPHPYRDRLVRAHGTGPVDPRIGDHDRIRFGFAALIQSAHGWIMAPGTDSVLH